MGYGLWSPEFGWIGCCWELIFTDDSRSCSLTCQVPHDYHDNSYDIPTRWTTTTHLHSHHTHSTLTLSLDYITLHRIALHHLDYFFPHRLRLDISPSCLIPLIISCVALFPLIFLFLCLSVSLFSPPRFLCLAFSLSISPSICLSTLFFISHD